jgi:mannose-6-phosphate isomerase-like protein (cupin superfamily)
MNKQLIISELQKDYPRKTVICIPEENPKELLCEIDPTTDHSEYSRAIAVIDRSTEHIHTRTTETYEILKGELLLIINGKEIKLKKGESYTIHPNIKHSARGNSTWVKVLSHPGWTKEDHIFVD